MWRRLLVPAVAAFVVGLPACGGDSDSQGAVQPGGGERSSTTQTVITGADAPTARAEAAATKEPTIGPDGQPILFSSRAKRSWKTFAARQPGQVGLAAVPLTGGRPEKLGSLQTGHAWSSIKVPIVTAAARKAGSIDELSDADVSAALERSDNAAAKRIFDTLGSLSEANALVETELSAIGDKQTKLFAGTPPAGLSTYGQTRWSNSSSALFLARLDCNTPDADAILGHMRNVTSSQRWGAGRISGAAIKGGWGPEADGGYLVRQVARFGEVGISVIVKPRDGQFASGTKMVTAAMQWAKGAMRKPPAPKECG